MNLKLLILTLLSTFLFVNIYAQELEFEWAVRIGGTSEDNGNSITTDANGVMFIPLVS